MCLLLVLHFQPFFLHWPLTVLMKQTRETVCAVEQSILLRCLWQNHSEVDLIKLFWSKFTYFWYARSFRGTERNIFNGKIVQLTKKCELIYCKKVYEIDSSFCLVQLTFKQALSTITEARFFVIFCSHYHHLSQSSKSD